MLKEGDILGWVVHTTGTHTGDQLGFPATHKSFEALSANIGDGQSYNQNLWIDHPTGGAAYLPR